MRTLLILAKRPILRFLLQIVWDIHLEHDVIVQVIHWIEGEKLWYEIVWFYSVSLVFLINCLENLRLDPLVLLSEI